MIQYAVLVTGSSGLIGSELVRQLVSRSDTFVRGLDIRPPKILPPSNFEFYEANVLNTESMRTAFTDVEIIVHLASVMGVANTEQRPLNTIETIVDGAKNVLELAKQNHIKKFVYSSSSEVYGDALGEAVSETTSTAPKSVYGSAKLTAEYLCRGYYKEHGMNYSIVRFFNVFGEWQEPSFVIPAFIDRAIQNQDLKVYGPGTQIRAFCDVRDAVDALIGVASVSWTNGQVYNIGNPNNAISMRGLAEKIISLVPGTTSSVRNVAFGSSSESNNREELREIYFRVPRIEAISHAVGFQPKHTFDESLRRIIAYKMR